jgi:hypothetical protein
LLDGWLAKVHPPRQRKMEAEVETVKRNKIMNYRYARNGQIEQELFVLVTHGAYPKPAAERQL